MHADDTPRCWSNHLGLWCIEPFWFASAVTAFKEGLFVPHPQGFNIDALSYDWNGLGHAPAPIPHARSNDVIELQAAERRPYDLTREGTAIIPLMGPITKAGSFKFEGASSVRTQRALRVASTDPDVGSILLHIDSPGGHVAGIDALAGEVRRIRERGEKRIAAHIDDLGASAAYWVGSQADTVSASAVSEVGSLGTLAVVEDTSGRMDRLGVKVHVLSTGPYKGIGVEGAPLTEASLTYLKERVEAMNEHFIAAVQHGRRMRSEQVRALFDGKVHMAREAQALGLIDTIQSIDEAVARLVSPGVMPGRQGRVSQAAARLARAQTLLALGGAHASHDGRLEKRGN